MNDTLGFSSAKFTVHSKAGAVYFAEIRSRLEPVVWDFLAGVNFKDVSVSA